MLPDGVTVRLDAVDDFLSVLPTVQAEYDPKTFCASSGGRRPAPGEYGLLVGEPERDDERVFDPYELALVEDGWYVFGHCHRTGTVRMFAVQRVRSLCETGETFDRPAGFRAEDFMKGSFRAVRGDGDHRVVLRFGPQAAGWFAEKRWHASQVLEPQPDGSVIDEVPRQRAADVRRWVMWWGRDCEVMEPHELRDLIT